MGGNKLVRRLELGDVGAEWVCCQAVVHEFR